MENRAHALVAGLFVIVLGLVLLAVVVWFRGDHVERVERLVVARGGVPGLSVKAPVRLRGVDVGVVESIAFDPADPRRILVRIAVDKAAPLTRGTVAKLGYQGVTGLSFIDLGDRGHDTRLLASLPDNERVIELQPSLLDQISDSGPALLANANETANRINALLAPANQQRVLDLLASARQASDRIGERAQQLQPAIAALPGLLARLDAATRRADAGLAQVAAAASSATALADDLRTRAAVLDRFGSAAARVETMARNVEVGLVGVDAPPSPPLVDELGRAARGIDRTFSQLRDEPQSVVFGRPPVRPGPGEAGFGTGPSK